MTTEFATSMDAYLNYLKERLNDTRRKGNINGTKDAEAEYSRALAFARRNGQTSF